MTGEQVRRRACEDAMDMTRFLHRSLTNDELLTRDGRRYEGRVAQVIADKVYNKFKMNREETVPIIRFDDGWDWIPNMRARRDLTEAWGPETEGWIGRRMAIYLVVVGRMEKGSGKLIEKLEKMVEPLADDSSMVSVSQLIAGDFAR